MRAYVSDIKSILFWPIKWSEMFIENDSASEFISLRSDPLPTVPLKFPTKKSCCCIDPCCCCCCCLIFRSRSWWKLDQRRRIDWHGKKKIAPGSKSHGKKKKLCKNYGMQIQRSILLFIAYICIAAVSFVYFWKNIILSKKKRVCIFSYIVSWIQKSDKK